MDEGAPHFISAERDMVERTNGADDPLVNIENSIRVFKAPKMTPLLWLPGTRHENLSIWEGRVKYSLLP